jgi:hypothetical protein
VVRTVKGLRLGSDYLLVDIAPPLSASFEDGPVRDFDSIILNVVGSKKAWDAGILPAMADIVICPTNTGGVLDERSCSRIGVGTLHATLEEAKDASPVE